MSLRLNPSHVYTALWYEVASGDSKPLESFAEGEGWGAKLAGHALGQVGAAELLAAARATEDAKTRGERLCEAHCFIGLELDLAGDRENAKTHYEASVATGVAGFNEFQWAQTRLWQWGKDDEDKNER